MAKQRSNAFGDNLGRMYAVYTAVFMALLYAAAALVA